MRICIKSVITNLRQQHTESTHGVADGTAAAADGRHGPNGRNAADGRDAAAATDGGHGTDGRPAPAAAAAAAAAAADRQLLLERPRLGGS